MRTCMRNTTGSRRFRALRSSLVDVDVLMFS